MRRHTIVTLAVILFLGTVLGFSEDRKRRIAILDFEFGTVQQWWSGNWDIGKGISDLIVTDLVEDGTYRLIERNRLDAIMAEQELTNSNRADASTAAKIGKLLGVDAIIVGSITKFGTEQKKKGFGGFGGGWGGFGGGKVGTSEGKANVAIDARAVDVNTGEILAVAKGEGTSSRSGLLLGGVGAGSGGIGGGEIDMSSSDFEETVLGEAVQKAVNQLTEKLVAVESKIPVTAVSIEGIVADVDGATLILNIGTGAGLSVGDMLAVSRVTRTVKDPTTGEVIRRVTEEVGEIRIVEADAKSSVASVVSGSGFKVGDRVSAKQ